MTTRPELPDSRPAQRETDAAFTRWLRRLVTGAAELEAFDAGQVDAVMDQNSGSAVLLPEAQSALHYSNRIALSALDALPGEVCVLDSNGNVVMANKAWRDSGVAHMRAGLDVRAGQNLFAACREVPADERAAAISVTEGLREVLAGTRYSAHCSYPCQVGRKMHSFTLTIAAISGDRPLNAIMTRAWSSTAKLPPTPGVPKRSKPRRQLEARRAGAANHLLAALPANEYANLAGSLEPVQLSYGQVLFEPGEPLLDVFFPCDALVSLLTVVEGHRAIEVGLVGREGMIGAQLVLGASSASVRAQVQGGGIALRMQADALLRELARSPEMRRVLLQFTDTLMVQISQTAACNRFHLVEARLARWLLMTAERMGSGTFHLTHAFLADMLGVRRVGVTVAACALQNRGLISYSRGNITILDSAGLEGASCSCYRFLKSVSPTLAPDPAGSRARARPGE